MYNLNLDFEALCFIEDALQAYKAQSLKQWENKEYPDSIPFEARVNFSNVLLSQIQKIFENGEE